MLLLPTPHLSPPTVSELSGPPLVAEPLALLHVAMVGASLLVLAAADPPLLPPVTVL